MAQGTINPNDVLLSVVTSNGVTEELYPKTKASLVNIDTSKNSFLNAKDLQTFLNDIKKSVYQTVDEFIPVVNLTVENKDSQFNLIGTIDTDITDNGGLILLKFPPRITTMYGAVNIIINNIEFQTYVESSSLPRIKININNNKYDVYGDELLYLKNMVVLAQIDRSNNELVISLLEEYRTFLSKFNFNVVHSSTNTNENVEIHIPFLHQSYDIIPLGQTSISLNLIFKEIPENISYPNYPLKLKVYGHNYDNNIGDFTIVDRCLCEASSDEIRDRSGIWAYNKIPIKSILVIDTSSICILDIECKAGTDNLVYLNTAGMGNHSSFDEWITTEDNAYSEYIGRRESDGAEIRRTTVLVKPMSRSLPAPALWKTSHISAVTKIISAYGIISNNVNTVIDIFKDKIRISDIQSNYKEDISSKLYINDSGVLSWYGGTAFSGTFHPGSYCSLLTFEYVPISTRKKRSYVYKM